MTDETWRPVVGWEEAYEVSDAGRVVNTRTRRLLRPQLAGGGYLRVQLQFEGRSKRELVHRLVIIAFTGPFAGGQESNHRNGVKSDNRLANLEKVTASVNMRHALVLGLRHSARGKRHSCNKLSEADVRVIRAAAGKPGQRALARQYGVTHRTVQQIQKRERWAWLDE